jgi:pyrroline-5-carboxylate reductase
MKFEQIIPTLGFIGAGNMASAIIGAVAAKGLIENDAIFACDIRPEKAERLASEYGIQAVDSLKNLVIRSRAVVLAVKPQDMEEVLSSVGDDFTPNHLVISIAAGVRTGRIEAALPDQTRLVRVMPNTPALIAQGAAAVAPGSFATEDDLHAVVKLFEAVGLAVVVKEDDLDAVTALSGSGPGYIFRMMEIFQKAGEEMGLPADLARQLTLQTFLGAAALAGSSPSSPSTLRRQVTSPGGTTEAALNHFEEMGLEQVLIKGIKKAKARSIELAS